MTETPKQAKAYPELAGVDTEGAEQVFHIANRWQANLSNAHPVHFELEMLLFSDEHNTRHQCAVAYQKYLAKQGVPFTLPDRVLQRSGQAEDREECQIPVPHDAQRQRVKRQKKKFMTPNVLGACDLPDCCGNNSDEALAEDSSTSSQAVLETQPADAEQPDEPGTSLLTTEKVVLNKHSRTVHLVTCTVKNTVQVKCSYTPPWGTEAAQTSSLRGSDLYT